MARRSLRPCLACKTLIRSGSYCDLDNPRRSSRSWQSLSSAIRRAHVAERGLVCPGLPELGHEEHAVASVADLAVDHVLPTARGGTDDPANLRVLCHEFNSRRRAAL